MITRVNILALFMAFLAIQTVTAQTARPVIDVNGIKITEPYTKEQVVAAWGEPEHYFLENSIDHKIEVYDFEDTGMMFTDGLLTTISLADPRFSLFKLIEGGFRVGDNLSRVEDLKLGILLTGNDGEYLLQLDQMDDVISIVTKNNIITRITYVETN